MTIKRSHLFGIAAAIFILFEAVMFYIIHIGKIYLGFNRHYACIIAAVVFSLLTLVIELITAKETGERPIDILRSPSGGNFLRIAMLFTLWADYYLVYADEVNKLAGVTVFIGTQAFIFLHILFIDKDKTVRTAHIITRISLTLILVIAGLIILGKNADALSIISTAYYANLCVNAIFAHRIGRGGIILTVGLIFFALCDINVGLSALNDIYAGGFPEGSLLYQLLYTPIDLVWVFYIPSQTLIPLALIVKAFPKHKSIKKPAQAKE